CDEKIVALNLMRHKVKNWVKTHILKNSLKSFQYKIEKKAFLYMDEPPGFFFYVTCDYEDFEIMIKKLRAAYYEVKEFLLKMKPNIDDIIKELI
ncbi:MAG: hypothetical protein ACTSYS_15445, partial [Promethearchaeota archaeon]